MKENYIDPLFQELLGTVSQKVKGEVDRSFDIAQRIADILQEKGWSKTDLAKKTGKSCSEVSKWLSGSQNFTLRTIALIEEALGKELIMVKKQASPVYLFSAVYPSNNVGNTQRGTYNQKNSKFNQSAA